MRAIRKTGILGSKRGVAALEFGLLAPLLAVLITCITEIGFTIYQAMQVSYAAEAGLIYAISAGQDRSGTIAAAQGATSLSGVNVSVTYTYGCPGSTGISYVSVSTASCSGGYAAGSYIIVTASLARKSIAGISWLPLPATLRAQGIVRYS